jgi:hypothetical protein
MLWTVFERSVRCFNAIDGPWGHFLAGGPTPELAQIEADHGPAIETATAGLRARYRALMLDLTSGSGASTRTKPFPARP